MAPALAPLLLLAAGEEAPLPVPAPAADAATARATAARLIDAERGAESIEKYRIVWPEEAPKTPGPGAEVVLIGGYISNYIVVFRESAVGFEASCLSMRRGWFYNPHGESFESWRLAVPRESFAQSWLAAQWILGARAERKVARDPASEAESRIGFSGSFHAPERWIRITRPGEATHSYLENQKGFDWEAEGTRDFENARDSVVFDLFHSAVDHAFDSKSATWKESPIPLESWRPFLRTELRRALDAPAILGDYEAGRLVALGVHALGEIGEEADLELFDRLEIAAGKPTAGVPSWKQAGREHLLAEIPPARTRLTLRSRWDPVAAAKRIRENPRRRHGQLDLARRVRALYFERDPKGYRGMLLEDLATGVADRELLLETIAEIGRRFRPEAEALLAGLRDSEDEAVADAARAAVASPRPREKR